MNNVKYTLIQKGFWIETTKKQNSQDSEHFRILGKARFIDKNNQLIHLKTAKFYNYVTIKALYYIRLILLHIYIH